MTEAGLVAGSTFGRYKIVRKLGIGGMASVYEAIHPELKKRVALKILQRHVEHYDEILQRFLKEGEAASRIHHPNVVDVYDVGRIGDEAYLVMEYLDGTDLEHVLAIEKRFEFARLLDIMIPVCAAVATAHDAGVIHRDLKPSNIFLARGHGTGSTPKVLDFGISKITTDPNNALTVGTAVVGTAHYLSAEQAMGVKGIDGRVDQYALGVTMYECLTGRRPFEAESLYMLMDAIVRGHCPPLTSLEPGLPAELVTAIWRAMSPRREERFPSLRHLGHALLPFASAKTRVIWNEFFDAAHTPPGLPGPSAVRGATLLLSPRELAFAGPEVPDLAAALLNGTHPSFASGSIAPPVPRARSLRVLAMVALALALLASAAAIFLHRLAPVSEPSTSASTTPVVHPEVQKPNIAQPEVLPLQPAAPEPTPAGPSQASPRENTTEQPRAPPVTQIRTKRAAPRAREKGPNGGVLPAKPQTPRPPEHESESNAVERTGTNGAPIVAP